MQAMLRRAVVETLTGYGRSAIYDKISRGEFPAPVKIGPRAVAWIESEVQDWLQSRIEFTRDTKLRASPETLAEAKKYFLANKGTFPKSVVVLMREKFSLSPAESVAVIREANKEAANAS